MRVLLIGIGGFAGSVLRYWLSGAVQQAAPQSAFPLGTLVVNLLGCLAIGILAELADARGLLRPDTRAFLLVGVLGGFTTFSAFANETMNAARAGAMTTALLNATLTLVGCLIAVWAGRALVTMFWR
jgi:CrcB protein